MTETKPTTLSDFDDADAGDGAEGDDPPTPEQNAEEIRFLADQMSTLTDHVSELADTVEATDGDESPDSIDTKPTDPSGMFQ